MPLTLLCYGMHAVLWDFSIGCSPQPFVPCVLMRQGTGTSIGPVFLDSHLCDWGHTLLVYDSMLLFLKHFLLLSVIRILVQLFCYLALLCCAFSVISTIVLYVPRVEIKMGGLVTPPGGAAQALSSPQGLTGILGPPYYGIGATIRIGRVMLCLPYGEFLIRGLTSHNFA